MRRFRQRTIPRFRDGKLWCPKCRQWLEIAAFGQDKGRKYGVSAYCKKCMARRDPEYQHQYYLTHRGATAHKKQKVLVRHRPQNEYHPPEPHLHNPHCHKSPTEAHHWLCEETRYSRNVKAHCKYCHQKRTFYHTEIIPKASKAILESEEIFGGIGAVLPVGETMRRSEI